MEEHMNETAKAPLPAKVQALLDAFDRGEYNELPAHEAAKLFPSLSKKQFDALLADIKENGLKNPIVADESGFILDGVHRLKACLMIPIRPEFLVWRGQPGEEIFFVFNQNFYRRHLTDRQRTRLAGKLAKAKRGRPKRQNAPNITQEAAAAALNVGERNIRKSRKIDAAAPENIRALVDDGKLSYRAAEAVANASDEEKASLASMSDDEAVATARNLAKEQDVARARSGQALIRHCVTFADRWSNATYEAREELAKWLSQDPNAEVRRALQTAGTTANKA
jgi:ParB-like chromosome segregation protein Spo0J